MKKYPVYKDSGVEWIDQIPNNWLIIPFRRVIEFLTDFEANGSFSSLSENVVDDFDNKFAWFVRATDLENKSYSTFQECRYINEDSYQYLSKTKLFGEELLIAKRGEIGKLYQMPKLGIKASLAPNLYLLRLSKEKMSPSFAYYYFISDVGHSHLSASNKSTTIGALYKDDCKKLEIIYPPISDQSKISVYLDYKTQKIDDLIAKKQKLIDLLKEERTTLINQAVSKGLDPTVPMKNSGIEWLGEIPKHWEVSKIKYSAEINNETLDDDTPEDFEFNYVDIGSVSFGNLNGLPEKLLFKNAPSRARRVLNEGDTIISTVRTYLKAILFIDNSLNEFIGSTGFAVLTPTRKFIPKFLYYIMTSQQIIEQICAISVGVSYPATNASDIGNISVWIPPLSEQEKIVNFIEERITHLTNIEERSYKEIDLISEYKTSLINEAVTGKIDVREYQINNA
jgi:type I restriction enzyme, S subunit